MKFDYRCLDYLVPYADLTLPVHWENRFKRSAPIEVEIGFGLGEVLVKNASDNPHHNFIGIEQNWERIYKALKSVLKCRGLDSAEEQESLTLFENLKILKLDARFAFEWLFAPESIHRVDCLFPCPWPKKAHAKNRLFSQKFLKLINNRLVPAGQLRIITDYYPYVQWIINEANGTDFRIVTKPIRTAFQTKFEKKWKEEGQEEFFEICLEKKKHSKRDSTKGGSLKSYKLRDFDPRKFCVTNVVGDVSVIHKDTIIDESKNKVLVHLVVAEKDLTQHFWVIISKAKGCWMVNKVDGQFFFPTPGIALAIKHIYTGAVNSVDENKQ